MNKPALNAREERDSAAPARLAAFQILSRVAGGGYASVLLAGRDDLELRDRALCHELVMGVLRFQLWLDLVIEHFAERSIARLDLPVLVALRLGLYQLRFLTRIPQSAAVNESVNLVREARVRSASSFVNAVLRRATREPQYDPVSAIEDPLERLAVSSSHPRWMIERWVSAFGIQETEALALANNQPAPVAFRVVDKPTTPRILDRLRSVGAMLEPSDIANEAWRVKGGGDLPHDLARRGEIYFQDEASQLVAQIVAEQFGNSVLDVCSAPGSKTSQIAAATRAAVVAGDVHLHRIKTVREVAALQDLRNITCVVLDGESRLPFRDGCFERVLVDAPCSGTGTLRHNPEIRWRISAEDIADLSQRQRQLLLNAAHAVKPGGRLVYSTCSVEPEENEAVVRAFQEERNDFESMTLNVSERLLTSRSTARTWPHRDNTDGFFVAAFARRS